MTKISFTSRETVCHIGVMQFGLRSAKISRRSLSSIMAKGRLYFDTQRAMTHCCVSWTRGIDSHRMCLAGVSRDAVGDMVFEVACTLIVTSPGYSDWRTAVINEFIRRRSKTWKSLHDARNAGVVINNNSLLDTDSRWHAEMCIYCGVPCLHLLRFRVIRKNHRRTRKHTKDFLLRRRGCLETFIKLGPASIVLHPSGRSLRYKTCCRMHLLKG